MHIHILNYSVAEQIMFVTDTKEGRDDEGAAFRAALKRQATKKNIGAGLRWAIGVKDNFLVLQVIIHKIYFSSDG